MIYDCFMFNNELDLLEIRCEELKHLDIIHILVEADTTFTGNPKPMHFLKSGNRFDKYNIRPYFVFHADMPAEATPWDREKYQRNAILEGLHDAEDHDIIIIADADEIPRALTVDQYTAAMGVTALRMDKYGYYLNCQEGKQSWDIAKIMVYGVLNPLLPGHQTPDEIRNNGFRNMLPNGGWHFSYLGGVDAILDKLSSFSHQEESVQRLNNREIMEHKYATCQSLWGEDYWHVVEIDETFPSYLINNISKFYNLTVKYYKTD